MSYDCCSKSWQMVWKGVIGRGLMQIFLTQVSVISKAFGFKMRFFLLHLVDVVSILGFEAQGHQSSRFSTSRNFYAKTKQKTMEIPVMQCSLILADMRSEFSEVNIIFDYVYTFLHSELMKRFLGIANRVVGIKIVFQLAEESWVVPHPVCRIGGVVKSRLKPTES